MPLLHMISITPTDLAHGRETRSALPSRAENHPAPIARALCDSWLTTLLPPIT